MSSEFNVDLGALADAARAFEAQAERLAVDIELLSGLGVHSAMEGLHTGADDLDATIGAQLDEIVEALAGSGERLQQTASTLNANARNYEAADMQVADRIDAIQP